MRRCASASRRAMERRGFVVATADSCRRRDRRGDRSAAGLCRRRHAARRRPRVRCRHRAAPGPPRCPHRDADRLRQHRDSRRGGQGGRDRLSAKAGRRRRRRARPARPGGRRRPSRRKTRCRPIGCAGSTSSASSKCATATSRKPHAGSRCTAAPCSASSPSTRHEAEARERVTCFACRPAQSVVPAIARPRASD